MILWRIGGDRTRMSIANMLICIMRNWHARSCAFTNSMEDPSERIWSLGASSFTTRIDVTLFATGNSQTKAKLHAIAPHGYEEDRSLIPKVWECLHISEVFERASDFDLIHNHFDFLPLTFSRLVKTPVVTTIHGFSSPGILPVYEKYDDSSYYVAISNSDKSTKLHYIATVYHGIDIKQFTFREHPEGDYLIFLGRIHPDKGTKEAIEILTSEPILSLIHKLV